LTPDRYDLASAEAIDHAWLQYEAERRDLQFGGWYPRRAYYVDHREIVVTVDLAREFILTCLHEHFGRGHIQGRHHTVPVGEIEQDYRDRLTSLEQHGQLRRPQVIQP
jgi:hypothetical protein